MSMLPDTDTNAVEYLSPFLELANVDILFSCLVFLFLFLEIPSVVLSSVVELAQFLVGSAGFNQVSAKEQG